MEIFSGWDDRSLRGKKIMVTVENECGIDMATRKREVRGRGYVTKKFKRLTSPERMNIEQNRFIVR